MNRAQREHPYPMGPLLPEGVARLADGLAEDRFFAMAMLARTLLGRPWASTLDFDSSHGALWIARRGMPRADLTVTYRGARDDRHVSSDQPSAFEVVLLADGRTFVGSCVEAVGWIADWVDTPETHTSAPASAKPRP